MGHYFIEANNSIEKGLNDYIFEDRIVGRVKKSRKDDKDSYRFTLVCDSIFCKTDIILYDEMTAMLRIRTSYPVKYDFLVTIFSYYNDDLWKSIEEQIIKFIDKYDSCKKSVGSEEKYQDYRRFIEQTETEMAKFRKFNNAFYDKHLKQAVFTFEKYGENFKVAATADYCVGNATLMVYPLGNLGKVIKTNKDWLDSDEFSYSLDEDDVYLCFEYGIDSPPTSDILQDDLRKAVILMKTDCFFVKLGNND